MTMFGTTRAWMIGASRPAFAPGLFSTKVLNCWTKLASMILLRPARTNSRPSAAWMRAPAARAALPLRGSRAVACRVFMDLAHFLRNHPLLRMFPKRVYQSRWITRQGEPAPPADGPRALRYGVGDANVPLRVPGPSGDRRRA